MPENRSPNEAGRPTAAPAKDPAGPNPFAQYRLADTTVEQTVRPINAADHNLGPSLYERFKANARDAFFNGTIAGAGYNYLNRLFMEDLARTDPYSAAVLEGEARARRRRFEQMPGFETTSEAAVALVGQLAGSAPTPESLIPGPRFITAGGKLATKLGARGTRAVEQAVAGGAINVAVDPIVQGLNIAAGVQDQFDPLRTAVGGALGIAVGGGFGFVLGGGGVVRGREGLPGGDPKKNFQPSFLGDRELISTVQAWRADPHFDFGAFEKQFAPELKRIKKEAAKQGVPVRQDAGATFVELYVAHPKIANEIAPDLSRTFDAILATDQFEGLGKDVLKLRILTQQRRSAAREQDLPTVIDTIRSERDIAGDPVANETFHVLKRGPIAARFERSDNHLLPDRDFLMYDLRRFIRQNHDRQIAKIIGGRRGDLVGKKRGDLEKFITRFHEALVIANDGFREATGQGPLVDVFETVLWVYQMHPGRFRNRVPEAFRDFEGILDDLDPAYRRWINRSRQGAAEALSHERFELPRYEPRSPKLFPGQFASRRPPRRAPATSAEAGAPLSVIAARPAKGIADSQRTARLVGDAVPKPPSVQSVSRDLARGLGFDIRQGLVKGKRGYDSGVLRVAHLNDFPIVARGAAEHIVSLLTTRDRKWTQLFLDSNARFLRRVTNSYGHLVEMAGNPTAEQQGLADFLYFYMTARPLVNKNMATLTKEFIDIFERRHPEMLASLDAASADYQTTLVQSSRDAMRGRVVSWKRSRQKRSGIRERDETVFDAIPAVGNWVYTSFVDDLNPINRAVRALAKIYQENTGELIDLKAANDAYKLARLTRGAHSAGQMDLANGVTPYHGRDPEGPSMFAALEEAFGSGRWSDQMIDDFGAYTASLRLLVEWRRFFDGDLPGPPDAEPAGSLLRFVDEMDAARPNFRAAAMKVHAYGRQQWRLKYEAGLITKDAYEAGLTRPFYVPVLRDMSDKQVQALTRSGSDSGAKGVLFKFKGSDRDIVNPIQAMIMDSYQTRAIIARNDVFKALEDLSVRAGFGSGRIVERLSPDEQVSIGLDHAVAGDVRAGHLDGQDAATLNTLADEAVDGGGEQRVFYGAGAKGSLGENVIYVWRDGERQALRLADGRFGREMYGALTGMNRDVSSLWIATVSRPSTILRTGVTASPSFMFANLVRDQMAAWVLNEGYRPFVDAARGFKSEITRSEVSRLYNSFGGIHGGVNVSAVSKVRVDADIRQMRRKGYVVQGVTSLPTFFKKLLSATELSETATRQGLFEQSYKMHRSRGLTEREALIEAAYVARDFIDFSRKGARMLHIRRTATFTNAALQGVEKFSRAAIVPAIKALTGQVLTKQEQAALPASSRIWAKATALGLFGLTLTALYRDDPEYEEISDYLKATHWMVKLFGEWTAIPKPFEPAFLSNVFERSYDAIAKDDPLAWQRLRDGLVDLMLPPFNAPVADLVLGLGFNKDRRFDRPVVPEHMKALEPALQFNTYTSEFARSIGKRLGVSPQNVDFVFRTVGGTLGREFLKHTNQTLNANRPDLGFDDTVFTHRFIRDISRGSTSQKEFWHQVGRRGGLMTRKARSYKRLVDDGDDSGAEQYLAKMSLDERAYAILKTHFAKKANGLHPFARAGVVSRVISKVRKALIDGYETVSPSAKRVADDLLSRMAMGEARNALIAIRARGWKQKKPMDPGQELKLLEEAAPAIASAYKALISKAGVVDGKTLQQAWPAIRERILRDGADADIDKILGDVRRLSGVKPKSHKRKRRK